MPFTEFYCNPSTGSNVNAGSTEGSSVLSLTGGDWVAATGVFTKTGEITGVSIGDFAAVRVDGATLAALVGRVTTVDADTIIISTTAKSGSLADQTGTCSIEVGGAWLGPNAAVDFPFDFITATLMDSDNNSPRINLKNNATYAVTASIIANQAGPIAIQGYSSTPGDGGRATIDGGTTGASYTLISAGTSSTDWFFGDLIVQNNGATAANGGLLSSSGARAVVYRVKAQNSRLEGISTNGSSSVVIECEVTNCNQSGSANRGGFASFSSNPVSYFRCYSHDHNNNIRGFTNTGITYYKNCIAENCTLDGFNISGAAGVWDECDTYKCSDGIDLANGVAGAFVIQNCNLIDNAGWGINGSGSGSRVGIVMNCGFGSGTAENGSGTTTGLKNMTELNSVTYDADVTPWVDPDNGDFNLSLAAAKKAGIGTFPPGNPTVGYPDIGAAQAFASAISMLLLLGVG